MKNKFLKIALTVITIAFVVQVGMRLFYPQPEEAKAVEIPVTFTINWGGFDQANAEVTVQQCLSDGTPVGLVEEMVPNGSFTNWTFTFDGYETGATGVIFNWIFDPEDQDINMWTGFNGNGDRDPPYVEVFIGGIGSGYVEPH